MEDIHSTTACNFEILWGHLSKEKEYFEAKHEANFRLQLKYIVSVTPVVHLVALMGKITHQMNVKYALIYKYLSAYYLYAV